MRPRSGDTEALLATSPCEAGEGREDRLAAAPGQSPDSRRARAPWGQAGESDTSVPGLRCKAEPGMPVLNLTVQHGRTIDEAKRGLETTVNRVPGQLGNLVRRVVGVTQRFRARLLGIGIRPALAVVLQAVQ